SQNTEYRALLEKAKKKAAQIKELSEKELGQVSNTVHSQGVVAVVHQREFRLEDVLTKQAKLIVALDAVNDPGNLGSIIRSCDWFGVDALLLGNGCVELYNEKVVRSTAGSIFHIPVVEGVDLPVALSKVKKSGYAVVTLSGDGTESYVEGRLKAPAVLVFGSEAHGVSKEVRSASDAVLKIPGYGSAESLNVGVACGIVLAHVRAEKKNS
ncbi:MAG TPA: RNA methyltransferase, partial [Bacteroidota bacterium]